MTVSPGLQSQDTGLNYFTSGNSPWAGLLGSFFLFFGCAGSLRGLYLVAESEGSVDALRHVGS